MATQTLSRLSSTTSTITSRSILHKTHPKSILKRLTPLSIRPPSPCLFPFSSSFSTYLTPTATSPSFSASTTKPITTPILNSPHVHFPPLPSLTSTYTTHSPNTYDHVPIPIPPNPLALPAWGDRPTPDGFKFVDPPNHTPMPLVFLQHDPSRLQSEFGQLEDPRSPKPTPPPRITPKPPSSSASSSSPSAREARGKAKETTITFADLPLPPRNPTTSLSQALVTYPRSPYPSAPLSPFDFRSSR